MQHSFPRLLFFIFLLSSSVPTSYLRAQVSRTATSDRPNIIFILTDDQRFDAIGYAGNELAHTPQMDQLAKAGTYFKTAIVTTPICAASRASIFTGLHERTHLYDFRTRSIRPEFMETAYPKVLREAGYYTGFYGKFGVKYSALDQLFDAYESYDRNNRHPDYRGYYYKTLDGDTVHLTRYTGAKALDFIEQAPSDQPFCLSLSFSAPHAHDSAPDQYFWQSEQDDVLDNGEVPGPALGDDRYFDALPEAVREGFNRTRWHWRYDTPEKYQHSVKGYFRMIAGIDQEVGKIREQLEKKGIADNTVIILMGDNGYFLGERQLAGKWLLYDNSIRVPLIVYDPRVEQHRDINDLTLNIDVPATMLDVAGVDRPESWQGKSLLPMVSGKASSLNRKVILTEHLWEFDHIPPSEGVRTDQWKYFRYVNDRSIEELYDLSQDPKEINNLAGNPEHQAKLQELRAQLEKLTKQYADPFSGIPLALTVKDGRDQTNTRINEAKPEYAWKLPAAAGDQSGYQVLVSSSLEMLNHRKGDAWNSGQVRSSASTQIAHGGEALQPNTTYYWSVRIWDKDNRTSEYASPQSFTTGKFE